MNRRQLRLARRLFVEPIKHIRICDLCGQQPARVAVRGGGDVCVNCALDIPTNMFIRAGESENDDA